MQIFSTEWTDRNRDKRTFSIDLNLWVIGAFALGFYLGMKFVEYYRG